MGRTAPLPKRSRFVPGDVARITHTEKTFNVALVSEDGESIKSRQGTVYIARFCEREESMATPAVQKGTRHRELDLPTTQAVRELAAALRILRALEGEDLTSKTIVQRSDHGRKIRHAADVVKDSRASLDSLLEDA